MNEYCVFFNPLTLTGTAELLATTDALSVRNDDKERSIL
jgi:hypothetical protein